jgi:putative transposase
MPDYRRYFVEGGTYFFTLVTANRSLLFRDSKARQLLGQVMRETQRDLPFNTVAIVLLPDHLHALWTLPNGDAAYPRRWQAIKARFTALWLGSGGDEAEVSPAYRRQRRRGVWQPRFIEHTIRDESDLHDHVDYIHYNPVKHGYVSAPKDWPWSSFHRYVASGEYADNWGSSHEPKPKLGGVDADLLE